MRLIAVAIAAMFLAGCQNSGSLACDGWKPIRPTVSDIGKMSDKLSDQILSHNEFGEKVGCWKAGQ